MPQKGRIISHLRLFIPKYREQIPFREVLEWAEKVYKKAWARSEKPIRLSDKKFWADKKDIARAVALDYPHHVSIGVTGALTVFRVFIPRPGQSLSPRP